MYRLAIPLLLERLYKSDSTKSRDGLVRRKDDTVIASQATELGYVCSLIRYQLKHVTSGQNMRAK